MAFDGDPYRTLGLARGASLDEVKRAYRRLVKANHPDAAGSGALARFLAIQAAYEQLVEGSPGPGTRSPAPSNAARRASEADPDRADATRRAYGGRPRPRRPADGAPDRDEPAGRDRSRRGPAAGSAPSGDAGPAARERTAEPGEPGPADAEAGRRRGKATLGSTSYDDASAGVSEPDWSGASWYGTTSGTYWTINPKEYADPRKHGPEYQARARRAAGARPEAAGEDAPERPAGPGRRRHADAASAAHAAGSETATAGAAGPAAGPASDDPADDAAGPPSPDPIQEPGSRWSSTSGPANPGASAASATDMGPTGRRRAADSRPLGDDQALDPGRALANLARALTEPGTGGLRGRVIRAFVGWLPVALGLGWVLGEITGCSRFAATCDPSVDPLILLVQGAALVVLFLTPSIAAVTAAAALALLAAAVVATLVLSATGTAADEASRRTTLGGLLVIAWLAGFAIAVAQRVRAASQRTGPVS